MGISKVMKTRLFLVTLEANSCHYTIKFPEVGNATIVTSSWLNAKIELQLMNSNAHRNRVSSEVESISWHSIVIWTFFCSGSALEQDH